MSNVIIQLRFNIYSGLNEKNLYVCDLSMYSDWSNQESLMALVTQ